MTVIGVRLLAGRWPRGSGAAGPQGSLRVDLVAHGRRHLEGEAADRVGVVGAEDEGADALVDGEPGQLLGPVAGAALEEAAAGAEPAEDVVHPPDRLRAAPVGLGPLVHQRVHLRELVGIGVPHRRDPRVGQVGGDAQHPRLVGAEPDRDVVGRAWTAVQSLDPVVLALRVDGAARPDLADDVDRLDQRVDRLLRRTPRPAGGLDRVPEGTCAEAELDPAGAEQVERGGAAREDHRRPQRQVGHVGGDADRAGAGGDHRQQRPGVEVLGLVGVVLDRDQVEAADLGQLRELEGALGRGGVGTREDAELQVVSVVGHRSPPSVLLQRAQPGLQPQHRGNPARGDPHSQSPLQRPGRAARLLDVVEAHGVQGVGADDGQAGARATPRAGARGTGRVRRRTRPRRAWRSSPARDRGSTGPVARSPGRRTRRRA